MEQKVWLSLLCLVVLLPASCTPAAAAAPAPTDRGCADRGEGCAPAEAKAGEPYTIGVLAASTGGAAALGEPNGTRPVWCRANWMRRAASSARTGRATRSSSSSTTPRAAGDVAITLAKKLINDDKVVAIVGGTTSPESLALVPIVQEAKIPFISMASSSQIVEPVAERNWVFKTAQSNSHTAPWQVEYAKAKGLTKIANFYVNNAYGEDGRNAIRDAAKAAGSRSSSRRPSRPPTPT